MSTLLCLIQIIFRSSCYDIFLMCKVMFKHLRKSQNFRLKTSVYRNQTQHDHTKSILKLCMLIQLVENNICISISAQINTDTHSLTAGVIIQICNSVNLFVPHKLCNLLDQTCFIYKIRKFCNDNTGFTIWQCLNICHRTDTDLTTSCTICFLDSPCPKNGCSCWKIRTFDDIKKFFDRCPSVLFNDIIYNLNNCLDYFS